MGLHGCASEAQATPKLFRHTLPPSASKYMFLRNKYFHEESGKRTKNIPGLSAIARHSFEITFAFELCYIKKI